MITINQYFRGREHTPQQESDAVELLSRVNSLLHEYTLKTGQDVQENPHTNSMVSGETEGGFRLPDCPQGAIHSSHKEAKAVDVYDPENKIDAWVNDAILEHFGLYREHPDYTDTWCHLTTRAPGSGHRTFIP